MEMENNSYSNPGGGAMKNISFILLAAIAFLTPLVFYTGVVTLIFSAKLAVVATISILAIIAFLLGVLGSGEIEFPRSKITLGFLLFVLASVISAFFSGNVTNSIIGNIFEIGTSGSIILMFLVFLVSLSVGINRQANRKVVRALVFSSAVLVFMTVLTSFISKGILPGSSVFPQTLAGSYSDLGVFLVVSSILSVYLLSFGNLRSGMKAFIWVLLPLSLAIIGALNIKEVNILLGLFALVVFVYFAAFFRNQSSYWVKKSYPILLTLIFSVIILASGNLISGGLAKVFGISNFDVRPNLSSTMDVIKGGWSHNPITGSGPNRFSDLWAMYKPAAINQSDFWNINFFFGSGFIPTMVATTGLLGVLTLLSFFYFFIRSGIKALFVSSDDPNKRFFPVFLFLSSLFAWVSFIFYNPGMLMVVVAPILTGLFVSSLQELDIVKTFRVNIFSNPKANFVSVFLVVIFIVASVYGGFLVWEKVVASVIFNKAIYSLNKDGDINQTKASLAKVISIYPNDSYNRTLAEVNLLDIENIAQQVTQDGASVSESLRNGLQDSITGAIGAANAAVSWNPKNYQNHLTFGRIYESLAIKGFQGASDNARGSYAEVERLNPLYPATQLSLARLDVLENKTSEARDHLNKAISLKPNFVDAYYMLAQIEAADSNLPAAIKAVESATVINPLNAGLYFQLGLLKYNAYDYAGSAVAMENALKVAPDYANAKYFLGLDYYLLGKKDDALAQFESILTTNPGNPEVTFILDNIRSGKNPFANATPPIDNKPEKRKQPPLEQSQ